MTAPGSLFSNAEVPKNHVEDILNIDSAGEATERASRDPKLFGE
jgi:hypothetical protein